MSIFFIDLDTTYKNRFDLAKFMNYENDSFDILTSYFLHKLHDLVSRGNFEVTTQVENPEFISYLIYGDTQYDWILMEYNNITDIRDIVSGTILNYPSLLDLEQLYFTLISKDTTAKTTATKNKNLTVALDGTFNTVSGSNTGNNNSTASDKNYIIPFYNTDVVTFSHPLGKIPSVNALELDINNNLVDIGFTYTLPVGNETSQVIVNFDRPISGIVVLN